MWAMDHVEHTKIHWKDGNAWVKMTVDPMAAKVNPNPFDKKKVIGMSIKALEKLKKTL